MINCPPPARPCPLCGGLETDDLGPVIHGHAPHVAGVPIDFAGVTFRFHDCRRCHFRFKHPPLPEDKLLDCYRRSPGARWGDGSDARRRRYDEMAALLQPHAPGRRALDIGCSNGGFLHHLGPAWDRSGIEPGEEAAAAARQRGIRILGPTLDSLTPREYQFDAISAIDVVEHLVEPLPFFERAAALLAPGGVFLIVTGDSDTWLRTFYPHTYWYWIIPEHASFYSRPAIDHLAQHLHLRCIAYRRISHHRTSAYRKAAEVSKNLGYFVGHSVGGLGIPRLRRLFVERGAPGWTSARDHMLCVLQKT